MTSTISPDTASHGEQLEAFYQELARYSSGPLWAVLGEALTPEPRTAVKPHLWRWAEMRPLALRAAALVDTEMAERRVLMLLNPGLEGRSAVTQTLYAGIQIIMPGEIARSHRHTPAALRFIIEGEGGYTAVNGEKTIMRPGDFILTPNWTWHDHGNEAEQPMLWLDGLDLPLVRQLDAVFYEEYLEPTQPITKPLADSLHKYGVALTPTWEQHLGPYSPLLNYTWERTREALAALAWASDGSPYDDILLAYTNPRTGGPPLPTMGATIQLLRQGIHTSPHRHTASVVYHVAEGRGASVIDGQRFDWERGDTFVVPTWAWHEHRAPDGEAVLFAFDDSPVQRALGLYREEGRG